jgi:hypothetical protein
MKYCIDCKHLRGDNRCYSREFDDIDVVTGKVIPISAELCRSVEYRCGKEAKGFEEVTKFEKLLRQTTCEFDLATVLFFFNIVLVAVASWSWGHK